MLARRRSSPSVKALRQLRSNRHAERPLARAHRHPEPVGKRQVLRDRRDAAAPALAAGSRPSAGAGPCRARSPPVPPARRESAGARGCRAVGHAQHRVQVIGRFVVEQHHHVPHVEHSRHVLIGWYRAGPSGRAGLSPRATARAARESSSTRRWLSRNSCAFSSATPAWLAMASMSLSSLSDRTRRASTRPRRIPRSCDSW